MKPDRVAAIRMLLGEAEEAHGAYEAAELGGVYDREWAQWYAGYAVEHGLGPMLGREIRADELGATLAAAYADFEAADPTPAGGWTEYVARRLAGKL
jgi:hypothetical protein